MPPEYKYQLVQAWSGKVKTITAKDFLEVFGSGKYFPPEGATLFETSKSDIKWFLVGRRTPNLVIRML